MSATDKKLRPGGIIDWDALTPALIMVGAWCGGSALAGAWVSQRLHGRDTGNLLQSLLRGEVPWTVTATIVTAALIIIPGTLALIIFQKRRNPAKNFDLAARYMAPDRALADLTPKGREKRQRHLPGSPRPVFTYTLSGKPLALGLETTLTMIAGPRSGKSTCMAMPIIAQWKGPLVVTSNKAELYRTTQVQRAEQGQVWCFDPQRIANVAPTWYWNPIEYVADAGEDYMDIRAGELAGQFVFANTSAEKNGGYFNTAATSLLTGLILAAALTGGTLLDVRRWVTNPNSVEPLAALRGRYNQAAMAMEANANLNPEQRDGVYGTADAMTRFLAFKSLEPWITPGGGRRRFDPSEFVRSGGTLYSQSKDGEGTMGPLVTALTVAVCQAGEVYAETLGVRPDGSVDSNRQRLPEPMGLVLDEVANTCRWSGLPSAYSHFAARGMILMSFLQSWSQGAGVWGDAGMKAMWSASTTRIIGPSTAENGFHKSLSEMVGTYLRETQSTSTNERGRSASYSGVRDNILDVSDISAMPLGRMLLAEAAHPAAITQLVPYKEPKKRGTKKPSRVLGTRTRTEPEPDTAPVPVVTVTPARQPLPPRDLTPKPNPFTTARGA